MKTVAQEHAEMRKNIRILRAPRFRELSSNEVLKLSGDQYLNYKAKQYNAN